MRLLTFRPTNLHIHINESDYVAKGWPGPHKLNVFQQIYNFANQQHGEMSAWGLLLIPDENPKVIIVCIKSLFFISENLHGTAHPFISLTHFKCHFFEPPKT